MLLIRLLTTYILIIVMALLVTGTVVFDVLQNTVKEQYIYSNELILNNGADLLFQLVKENKDTLLDIAIDSVIQEECNKFVTGYRDIRDLEKYIENSSNYKSKLQKNGTYIEIIPYDGRDVYRYNNEENEYMKAEFLLWMESTIKKNGAVLIEKAEYEKKSFIRLSMVMRSIEYWQQTAIVAVYINTDVLFSLFYDTKLANNQMPYLVDDLGNIVIPYGDYYYLEKEDLLYKENGWWIKDGNVIINKLINGMGWKMIGVLPKNKVMEKGKDILYTFFIVGIVTVFFLTIVSIYFSYWITNPIKKLSDEMHNVEKNKFQMLIIGKRYPEETKQLYRQFNYMIRRIDTLIQEVYLAKIKEKEAELCALQQQINPHFLYNTLDSIAWMAMPYKAEDIRCMVMSLANMMRHSLNGGDNHILVRNELEQIRNYLAIQEIRYENKFTVSIKFDEDVLDYKIIKLIIQPLVENAIKYGLIKRSNTDYMRIDIIGEKKDGDLVIRVINDGNKVDLERIKKILNLKADEKSKHYGLRNVNDRLIKKYGKKSRVNIYIENGRTVAKIIISTNLLQRDEHTDED
ncbi:sensor histidine kinase [Vallitalea maricola]|uniref:Sensor histidine kinase n=1 Tax=Vallitalea maricola TaxID=3074433 RepID=A0ACB5UM62_9FIRM|nr:sensor histidine kinase [Vallitalea sp. AN17-2]